MHTNFMNPFVSQISLIASDKIAIIFWNISASISFRISQSVRTVHVDSDYPGDFLCMNQIERTKFDITKIELAIMEARNCSEKLIKLNNTISPTTADLFNWFDVIFIILLQFFIFKTFFNKTY